MRISDLFDKIRTLQDGKCYSGALSARPVRVETIDSDTLYSITSISYDETLGCYIIKAGIDE